MKPVKIYNVEEASDAYSTYVKTSDIGALNLASWLPDFDYFTRPVMPGECVFIMAEPGVGKSMICQQICVDYGEPSLFFEMELPLPLMFERFMQNVHMTRGEVIESEYKSGRPMSFQKIRHIRICDASRLSLDDMKRLIEDWRKTDSARFPGPGSMPEDGGLVVVDYIGLMASTGKSRYERVSVAAEDLKSLAKQEGVIVLAATQMNRKDDSPEPDLHRAKDSSSIEDAADLLIGLWRGEIKEKGFVKILKNRKGQAGGVINCDVQGHFMRWVQSTDQPSRDGLRYRSKVNVKEINEEGDNL